MMRSKSPLLPLAYPRVVCLARVRASVSPPEGDPNLSVPNSGAAYPPEGTKEKLGSGRHGRWARARALRWGRVFRRRADGDKERSGIFGSSSPLPIPSRSSLPLAVADEAKDGGEAKAIFFLVSDRTGWTAEHAVDAALGQFEHCLVHRLCPMNTHLFSGIDDTERLADIIKEAAKEGALLLYTLADPAMAEASKNAWRLWGVPSADVMEFVGEFYAQNPLWPMIELTGKAVEVTDDVILRILHDMKDKYAMPQIAKRAPLGRSRGFDEGCGNGAAAAGLLQRYVIAVEEPDGVTFASWEEREAWYKSFIPVDDLKTF